MQLDPELAEPGLVYATLIRIITPRPIAWVSTISESGITNLAPFSFFNGVGSRPAALMFSVVNHPDGQLKDTAANIRQTGQFVVNLVPFALADPMFQTSQLFESDVSEFAEAGLTEKPSRRVRPPGVMESPVQLECELLQLVEVGQGPLGANVIIGRILLMEIDDRLLDASGKIDPELADTIGRMGGRGYCRTCQRFDLPSPG